MVSARSNGKSGRTRNAVTAKTTPLRVYVVEHNPLAEQYLLRLLAEDRRIKAISIEDLVPNGSTGQANPIFVIDREGLDLPLGECLHVLREHCGSARFLALDEDRLPEETVQLLALGIQGVVAYSQVDSQLCAAIHSVAEHRMWVSAATLEEYVRTSIRLVNNGRTALPTGQVVTHRESEILELVKRRLSNKEIGAALNIKESTVKFHVSNIISKMQVNCRSDLHGKNPINHLWRRLTAS